MRAIVYKNEHFNKHKHHLIYVILRFKYIFHDYEKAFRFIFFKYSNYLKTTQAQIITLMCNNIYDVYVMIT